MKSMGKQEKLIHVMVADDHPIVRQGLELVLSNQEDIILVASAADGIQAVREALLNKPDVIILDIQMPGKDGLTAIEEILRDSPATRILVLTSFPDDEVVFSAIKAGAMGFLLKDSPPDFLIQSIRLVHQGEVALHPMIARKLMEEIKNPSDVASSTDPLTPREQEVLVCLAQGLSNYEIGVELTISIRTVTTHVRNILDKLHLSNRTQAALYALEKGIAPNFLS